MIIPASSVQTIAIFRALQLGDLLCAVPGFRALRHLYPDATISLIGLPWQRTFVERFSHYFDAYIPFTGFPGLPELSWTPDKSLVFLHDLHQQQFSLLVQMQGNGAIVNPLLALAGAQWMAGFYQPKAFCPDSKLFVEYPEHLHEIYRHLELMRHLGATTLDKRLEFPIRQRDRDEFDHLHLGLRPYSYVCIHGGARDPKRQWDPSHLAVLGDMCVSAGYQVVLTGVASEGGIAAEIVHSMSHSVINLSGKTTLGSMAVLIAQSRLVICNDTGISHLAVAVGTPSVVISLSKEYERWRPLDQQLHPTVDAFSPQALADAQAKLLHLFAE